MDVPWFSNLLSPVICHRWRSEKGENFKYTSFAKLLHIIGKSLSGALTFASNNPQCDYILFIELFTCSIQENSKIKPGENMLCTEIVFDIQNNFCTQHVLNWWFNEQSVVILWVIWCKSKSFWQLFICNHIIFR